MSGQNEHVIMTEEEKAKRMEVFQKAAPGDVLHIRRSSRTGEDIEALLEEAKIGYRIMLAGFITAYIKMA